MYGTGYLYNKEHKLNADALAADFRHNHRESNATEMFVSRTADNEFATIGKAHVGSKRAVNIDQRLLVWTGYEVVTKSKYLQ